MTENPQSEDVAQPGSSHDDRVRVVLAGYSADEAAARVGIDDPDPRVRAAALGALARMGRLGADDLRAGLHDPEHQVLRHAALLAARSPHGLDGLAEQLDARDPRVVEVAAFACGERSDAGAPIIDRLERIATEHEDSLCRESTVAALGSLGRATSLPVILAACDDRATVRRRAVLALAAFDDLRATEKLRAMSTDRDLQVRQAAEELLAIEEGGDW